MKIYKVRKNQYLWGGLFFGIILIALSISLIGEGSIERTKFLGLIGFWIIAIVLTLAPFGFKLEVGEDYVKTFFLGFCLRYLKRENIEIIECGNLMRGGGLGYGKGLKGWERTKRGNRKYFSIGEDAYGKGAMKGIARALSKDSLLENKFKNQDPHKEIDSKKKVQIAMIWTAGSIIGFFLLLNYVQNTKFAILVPISILSLIISMVYLVKAKS
jgi:amino acid permease